MNLCVVFLTGAPVKALAQFARLLRKKLPRDCRLIVRRLLVDDFPDETRAVLMRLPHDRPLAPRGRGTAPESQTISASDWCLLQPIFGQLDLPVLFPN